MVRKFASLLMVFVILFCCTTVSASATGDVEQSNIIRFDDGSYIEVIIEESLARAASTKTGYKLYRYRDASDNIEWEADLTATFTYDGTTSTCTSANCTVTIYDDLWYEISCSTSRSGATATTLLTMGKRFLGITISKPQYTITLTCDKDGNLS
jgi:hypothetical protein